MSQLGARGHFKHDSLGSELGDLVLSELSQPQMPPSTPFWSAPWAGDVSGPHFGSHCKTPVMPEELGEGELVPGWIYHPFVPVSKPSLGLAEAWQ